MVLARDVALFHLVLIKPTHYDDDGYPIQWFRSAVPSNTLACLNGLAEDARQRAVLGPDVAIRLHTVDEPIDVCMQRRSFATSGATAGGRWLRRSASRPISSLARSISHVRSLKRVCRSASAGFMCLAASLCYQKLPTDIRAAQAMGIALFAGDRRRGGSIRCYAAPGRVVVQALGVTTIGQVVTTSQELMRIVPANAPVQIEAYVTNDDIGFVSRGQLAVVKIDSFPFTRYGTPEATVEEVASDAIPTETANRSLSDPTKQSDEKAQKLAPSAQSMNDLVFEAKLRPRTYVIDINGHEVQLSPGMTVTVEIKTGSRRVLEYLFSPLVEVAGTATRER
jgi:HlyD family secretion protein